MTVIKLTNLGGVYPAVLPRNLPDNGAQVAHNLLARTTEFRPLLTDVAEAAISVANPRVVRKYRNNWLASSAPMSFAVTQVNGDTRQSSDLNQLIWNIPELLVDLSKFYHLQPGDLIFTGTPEGVGAVKPGDNIAGHVAGGGDIALTIGAAE